MNFNNPDECRDFLENLKPMLPMEKKVDALMAVVGTLLLNLSSREKSEDIQDAYKLLGESLRHESGLIT